MNKTMILIAGMPASGKTTFAKYLSGKLSVPLICKDALKEILWEKIHYDSGIRAESQKYGGLAYDLSFHFCDELMRTGQPFVFESNFTNPCPEILFSMVDGYGYRVVTVLFDGDAEVIHQRFIARDATEERHPGLVANYFNDTEHFKAATKACRDFNYGDVKIVVDSTNFSKISYEDIFEKIIEASPGCDASAQRNGGIHA